MTENINKTETGNAEYVLKTLRGKKKTIITGFIVRLIILIIVLGYLSLLYSWISQFEADTAFTMARTKLSERLPQMTKDLSAQLTEQAPGIMNNLEEKAKNVVPQLGAFIENKLKEKLSEACAQIEEDLTNAIRQIIREKLVQIEKENPNLTDDEKLKALTKSLRDELKTLANTSIDNLVAGYMQKMRELNDHLKKLQTDENLSEREIYQRDLIMAALKLIQLKVPGGLLPKVPEDQK